MTNADLEEASAAFAARAEPHRAELQLHCYRMLGAIADAEDLVQETLLRAWAKRETFAERASLRAWLYAIATNACLDELRRQRRRVLPHVVLPPSDPEQPPQAPASDTWLDPYPDVLIDAAGIADGPEERLLAREATELTFMVAIQTLPPRQRAVLLVRDVLEWSAKETAVLLDTTVTAVNSALQRAHTALAAVLPPQTGAEATAGPDALAVHETRLLQNLLTAWEHGDVEQLACLLRDDARLMMPPGPSWYDGRSAVLTFFARYGFRRSSDSGVRCIATRANRQPALAIYKRGPGDRERQPFGLVVVDSMPDGIRELTMFRRPELFALWQLPATA
jgi:RNA polymerase sigma-70 factor (ECF subfamily)